MEIELSFFYFFLITIFLTRVFLWLKPISSPTIKGFRVHHYMYGLILIPIGILLNDIVIYALGFGLFVDKLGYLIIRGRTHKENYSKVSLVLLAVFIILVYIFRKQLLFWVC